MEQEGCTFAMTSVPRNVKIYLLQNQTDLQYCRILSDTINYNVHQILLTGSCHRTIFPRTSPKGINGSVIKRKRGSENQNVSLHDLSAGFSYGGWADILFSRTQL